MEEWQKVMDINVKGVFLCTKYAIPEMLKNKKGSIINLSSIYDEVWNISATDLINPKYYDSTFDVIMIGDIIEHLKKSDGIDLLNFLIYRCRWIILEFPYRYLQNSVDGYHSEAHISVWTKDDLVSFERTQLYEKDTQRLILLRVYLENKMTVADIESLINKHE